MKLWLKRLLIIVTLPYLCYLITTDSWDHLARLFLCMFMGFLTGGLWAILDDNELTRKGNLKEKLAQETAAQEWIRKKLELILAEEKLAESKERFEQSIQEHNESNNCK